MTGMTSSIRTRIRLAILTMLVCQLPTNKKPNCLIWGPCLQQLDLLQELGRLFQVKHYISFRNRECALLALENAEVLSDAQCDLHNIPAMGVYSCGTKLPYNITNLVCSCNVEPHIEQSLFSELVVSTEGGRIEPLSVVSKGTNKV